MYMYVVKWNVHLMLCLSCYRFYFFFDVLIYFKVVGPNQSSDEEENSSSDDDEINDKVHSCMYM